MSFKITSMYNKDVVDQMYDTTTGHLKDQSRRPQTIVESGLASVQADSRLDLTPEKPNLTVPQPVFPAEKLPYEDPLFNSISQVSQQIERLFKENFDENAAVEELLENDKETKRRIEQAASSKVNVPDDGQPVYAGLQPLDVSSREILSNIPVSHRYQRQTSPLKAIKPTFRPQKLDDYLNDELTGSETVDLSCTFAPLVAFNFEEAPVECLGGIFEAIYFH